MAKTTYVWDELSDNVVQEYEGGVVTAEYTHEPGLYGNLISQNRGGTTHYYHYDGRGDTVALTDDSGNVTDTKDYDAWGNVIASTGSTNTTYHFAGRNGYQADSVTKSHSVRARYYSQSTGRWCSQDPLGLTSDVSLFRYNRNCPLTLLDPSGELTIEHESSNLSVKCGESAFIQWKITLDIPAPCDGYIVQKVEVRCDGARCPCEEFKTYPAAPDTVFFEAWKVFEKRSEPTTSDPDIPSPYWDRARHRAQKDTCGYASQTGEVKFFCEDKTHPAANGVGTGNLGTNVVPGLWRARLTHGSKCPVDTLDAVSTKSNPEPAFWSGTPVESGQSPPNDRFLTVDWVCCECAGDRVNAFGHPQEE